MKIPSKKVQFLGLVGFLLVSLIVIANFSTDPTLWTHVDARKNIPQLHEESEYLVSTPGCRITIFDPLDTIAKQFKKILLPIPCKFESQIPLIESNETAVFINPRAVNLYYNSSEAVNCSWQAFERKKNHDNFVKYHNESYKFENASRVSAEFVKVECYKSGKRIYRDYHFFVPQKPHVEERCRIAKKKRLERRKTNERDLNILILGLDAVSRRNFHRMMPKTARTLASLGAAEMLGYTKVGDNTYPNVVPVLSGLSDKELQAHCWSNPEKPFDDCPFLWKNFSQAGYRTVLAEDACSIGTFNHYKGGFQAQPTDYYLRPYCVTAEGQIGNTGGLSADLCVGARKTYENLLNYTWKITKKFNSSLYFAFSWQASLTHDYFNYPQLGDDTYSNFLIHLKKEKLLDNMLLIFISDHGIRYGEFRQTYAGRLETNQPFVFLNFPEWWKKKFPLAWNNIKKNTASLTTPFDLHETLVDLLKSKHISNKFIKKRSLAMNMGVIPRGISWFLPIPGRRTCAMAEIPGDCCMCHEQSQISLTEPVVLGIAHFMIDQLNKMLVKYPKCAVLKLGKIVDATIWTGDKREEKFQPEYTVSIVTTPGNATFEATIRKNGADTTVLGSINRSNVYGNQSACIDDSTVQIYCFCHV